MMVQQINSSSLKITLVIILFIGLTSCEKDNQFNAIESHCPACDSCANFIKDTLGGISREGIELLNERKAPCFNPLNADEFVFVKEQDSSRKTSLVKYNMKTHMETILLDNIFINGQPKWGRNGWIAFVYGSQLCLVKAEGKEVKKLSPFASIQYTEWKNDSIIACQFYANQSNRYYYGEWNIISGKLDTAINKYFNFGVINSLGEKAYVEYSGTPNITIENKDAAKKLMNNTADGKNEIVSIAWHPNNQDIFYSKVVNGIYKISKNPTSESLIKKGCNSRSYNLLSISNDGKKLLVERINATLENIKLISYKSDIYIMDIDGRNEEKVFK
jgi:hypothetical protein